MRRDPASIAPALADECGYTGRNPTAPFGTASEATVVPDPLAIDLPASVTDQLGATLGIPGITAHRAVFADGPVAGRTVLVHGVLGAVGSIAAALAAWGGATVIGTVRGTANLDRIKRNTVRHAVALDQTEPAAQIRAAAPDGLHRIVEVALSTNVDLDVQLARQGTVIAAYSSPDDRPQIPFWPLLFANVTLRLLGSDDFPQEAKQQAAQGLTALAAEGWLDFQIAPAYPLDRIGEAHEAVEAGARGGRVLLTL